MNDIALITGTSSGMGLHAAVELARRGLHVVATMRDTAKAGALRAAAGEAGVEVDVRALDVVDHAAAARLVAQIEAELGGIHVLVNNAGQGSVATAEQLTMDEVQAQLDINYLAPVNLTKLVLPGMRERGSGRILTVTSVGGAVGQPFADAYCGAKFAVEGFMQSLAVVAERFGVGVSVMEPAAVASAFVDNAIRPENGGPYGSLLDAYISRTAGAFANAQSAESAGAAIADAVLSDEYRFRWQSSEGATRFVGVSLADTDGSGVLGFTRSWIAAG
ncbi:SDR family NAD(P)-dependent oxidoreductase [Microbacterium maritypicum]|uniref:SDR family NAD(P)-dependent oxidoreductase n=1 Tax=Microbacterium maritypicum TaxID=33918 RepID=A0AAJ5VA61_MICMQ|nr:SDR family NAD(P)-dependent oxidoreductase [Microbacterium liquefaciens]WEF20493.1 SDR family NAD(P)-dependent oxidoreductase [Microbacterium liquefaciens]